MGYTEIKINPQGLVSAFEFTVPRNERRVKFSLPTADLSTDLFTVIDGQFRAFKNCSSMMTPVSFLDDLCSWAPHSGTVIAVQRKRIRFSDIEFKPSVYSKRVDGGKEVLIAVCGKMNASVLVKDSEQLAVAYAKGEVTNPEDELRETLKLKALEEANRLLPNHFFEHDPINGCNSIGNLEIQLANTVKDWAASEIEWADFTLQISLNIENMPEIIKELNAPVETADEIRKNIINACVKRYENLEAFNAAIKEILLIKLQAEPDMTAENILALVTGLQKITRLASSPDELLQTFKHMYTPASGGKLLPP